MYLLTFFNVFTWLSPAGRESTVRSADNSRQQTTWADGTALQTTWAVPSSGLCEENKLRLIGLAWRGS